MKIFAVYSREQFIYFFLFFFCFDGKFSPLREILKFFKFLQHG